MTEATEKPRQTIVALAGGVGGAKLCLGLYRLLQGQTRDLAIIGNTGDDLEMFGLRICPDLDTVLYTLAGIANPATGWGVVGDTSSTLEMLKRYGEDTWFWLGDRDFATHLRRTELLRKNSTLTEATAALATALGVECRLLPMSDQDVRTIVHTEEAGELSFQEYFVRRRSQDTVVGLHFAGIEQAKPTPQITEALSSAKLIVICPSNPYLSIDPILAVPGMRELVQKARSGGAKVVAVSPIVGGKAIKGPAAAIMRSLKADVSPFGVAKIYQDLADVFVFDTVDVDKEKAIAALGLQTLVTNTIMNSEEDKIALAKAIIEL